MGTIQDIHSMELRITDIVDDYIQQFYNEDDVLAIDRRKGEITVTADSREKIEVGKECAISMERAKLDERTPASSLQARGETESNYDKISEIANSWIFIN